MSLEHVEKLIKDHAIEFVDLRFVDMRGVQHHITFPVNIVEPGLFEEGKIYKTTNAFPSLTFVAKSLRKPTHSVLKLFGNHSTAWKIAGLPHPKEEELSYLLGGL